MMMSVWTICYVSIKKLFNIVVVSLLAITFFKISHKTYTEFQFHLIEKKEPNKKMKL